MMSEYVARLFGLSLASFFLVQLVVGLAVCLSARHLADPVCRMEPKFAARLLLALRWA